MDKFINVLAFVGSVVLCFIGLAAVSEMSQRQDSWTKQEPQDCAAFEKRFETSCRVANPLSADPLDQQKAAIRQARIVKILLPGAEQILSARRDLNQARIPKTDVADEVQIAAVVAAQKNLAALLSRFKEDIRLANRFAITGLYDDIDEELGHGGDWSYWCFTVDSLKKGDLFGTPWFDHVPAVAGCSD
jgi:hypothetical protein